MAVFKSTIFVTVLGVLALSLAACQPNPAAVPEKQVTTGAASPNGRALVNHQWCSKTRQDARTAHIQTDHYAFHATGEMEFETSELQTDGTSLGQSKSQGTWALVGDQLFIMNGQETLRSTLTKTARASDQSSCFTMERDAETLTLCPCS